MGKGNGKDPAPGTDPAGDDVKPKKPGGNGGNPDE